MTKHEQTTTPGRSAQLPDEPGRNNQAGADEPGYPMPRRDYTPRRVSYQGRHCTGKRQEATSHE